MPLRENASTTWTLPACGSATLDGPEVVTIDPFRFDDVATEGESGEATEPTYEVNCAAG
jgi:hypothetical protein